MFHYLPQPGHLILGTGFVVCLFGVYTFIPFNIKGVNISA